VLGINYLGDPHPHQYPIYPAQLGGDFFGVGRFSEVVRRVNPDVVCILQDPWLVTKFLGTDAPPDVPIVAYMPVDGRNMASGEILNGLTAAIWYTEFGQKEAKDGGYKGISHIIPHGVDSEIYYPGDQATARETLGLHRLGEKAFIVGNINRNQPRKRLDQTIEGFAGWWHNVGKPENAYLFLHCSRYDIGYDVMQLARYHGIASHMIMSKVKLKPSDFVPEEALRLMYQCLNLHISTSSGEGWGLTTHESMACGIPNAVVEWAALGEWPKGAVHYMPVTHKIVTAKGINVIGGATSVEHVMATIDKGYRDPEWCALIGGKGYARAKKPEFQWPNIAEQFHQVLQTHKRGEYANDGQTATPSDEQARNRRDEEASAKV